MVMNRTVLAVTIIASSNKAIRIRTPIEIIIVESKERENPNSVRKNCDAGGSEKGQRTEHRYVKMQSDDISSHFW